MGSAAARLLVVGHFPKFTKADRSPLPVSAGNISREFDGLIRDHRRTHSEVAQRRL